MICPGQVFRTPVGKTVRVTVVDGDWVVFDDLYSRPLWAVINDIASGYYYEVKDDG